MILDIERIRAARPAEAPFRWASIAESFVSRDVARELRDTFPGGVYERFVRPTGEKRHDLRGKNLRGKFASGSDEALAPRWQELVLDIASAEYRAALEAASGVALEGLDIAITAWAQRSGGFLDPHTDNPGKVLAHLFYFNDASWSSEDGGCLRILRSRSIDDVDTEVLPHLGRSVFFVRSERSWHGYLPVRADRERLALQVIFHYPSMEYSKGNDA